MAALSIAIRQTAHRLNRQRQHRAELRLDEIVKTSAIADDYAKADSAGDLNIERNFGRLWAAVSDEPTRDLIARTFAAWMHDERIEELAVRDSVNSTVALMKSNNPEFIEGVWTPADSDGVA